MRILKKVIKEELEELKKEKEELLQAYNSTQQAQETASEKIQVCSHWLDSFYKLPTCFFAYCIIYVKTQILGNGK